MSKLNQIPRLKRQKRTDATNRAVRFPHELIFNNIIKDGDSTDMSNFLRRESVHIDLNQLNEKGELPLVGFIKTMNLKCVEALVHLGANVNEQDHEGE